MEHTGQPYTKTTPPTMTNEELFAHYIEVRDEMIKRRGDIFTGIFECEDLKERVAICEYYGKLFELTRISAEKDIAAKINTPEHVERDMLRLWSTGKLKEQGKEYITPERIKQFCKEYKEVYEFILAAGTDLLPVYEALFNAWDAMWKAEEFKDPEKRQKFIEAKASMLQKQKDHRKELHQAAVAGAKTLRENRKPKA